jgi:glyoxylase-like metal-dependent hydrolase (beta-lactamase superfamily II)
VPTGGEEEPLVWTELDEIASRHDRPVVVLITVFWHERSASSVFERYSKTLGARVFAHEQGRERIDALVTDSIQPGKALPGEAEAFEVERADEVALWLPGPEALVVGDILLGREGGLRLCPPAWVGGEEQLGLARQSLRALLDRPIEMVLTSHGPPVLSNGRAALEAALA